MSVADTELKARHRAMWGTGDYPLMVETFLLEVGERLVEACGIEPRGRACSTAPQARPGGTSRLARSAERPAPSRSRRLGGRRMALCGAMTFEREGDFELRVKRRRAQRRVPPPYAPLTVDATEGARARAPGLSCHTTDQ